ncbi:ribonuclease H [Senna tora]|uniref:Ribonuclease H n=1 Tax=Senna tora TaxID=362788 RepID=A0A834TPY5_9FABA|nr:ribonuclease H [Senna tora]
MDESIIVSSIIDKLHSSWKDFKKNLKHKKEDIPLEQLGNHLRLEEEYRKQDAEKETNVQEKVHMVEEGQSNRTSKKRGKDKDKSQTHDARMSSLKSQRNRDGLHISWKPLNWPKVKLNVDGSYWNHIKSSGCGGVIRDYRGRWILGFARRMGRGSSINAEVWGILTGLQVAWDLGVSGVILESDSLTAINFIKNGVPPSHPLSLIFAQIQNFVARDWDVSFCHTLREGNRVANCLANFSHNIPFGIRKFDRCPDFCNMVIQDDIRGVCLPRGFAS